MRGKVFRSIAIAAVIFAGLTSARLANAQDSLQAQLTAKFKLAKTGTDSSGLSVIDAGTVLVVKKGGILSSPSGNAVVVPTYVKDGNVKAANNTAMSGVNKLLKWKGVSDPTGAASTDTKFLTVGEKVYAYKIDVNVKDSKVTMWLIECDTCNEVKDPSFRKAQVIFSFPANYLANADGSQVGDVITPILEVQADDSSQQQADNSQQQSQEQQAAPAEPAAPAAPPPTIELGQTTDQVTASMGQPQKIVNLGTKVIYYYKDMKVTFVKGKVTDVQ